MRCTVFEEGRYEVETSSGSATVQVPRSVHLDDLMPSLRALTLSAEREKAAARVSTPARPQHSPLMRKEPMQCNHTPTTERAAGAAVATAFA